MNIEKFLYEFIELILNNKIDVYNEFSLQHELGIYLREKMPNYKVQFERNVQFFKISDGLVKHEIDIVIYSENQKYAIELKYPLNGQYPEQMFSFVKDIKFMEELKENGFDNTYCLTLVQDKNFHSGKKQDGIYAYFRGKMPIKGAIEKPTGRKNEIIELRDCYKINWQEHNNFAYYILKI